MKKLRDKLGESIAETLVAVLVLSLAFVILTGAIAAAARVNGRIRNLGNDPDDPTATPVPVAVGSATVKVRLDSLPVKEQSKQVYQTNGNYYYE